MSVRSFKARRSPNERAVVQGGCELNNNHDYRTLIRPFPPEIGGDTIQVCWSSKNVIDRLVL